MTVTVNIYHNMLTQNIILHKPTSNTHTVGSLYALLHISTATTCEFRQHFAHFCSLSSFDNCAFSASRLSSFMVKGW